MRAAPQMAGAPALASEPVRDGIAQKALPLQRSLHDVGVCTDQLVADLQ
jgi:hypothetical protein